MTMKTKSYSYVPIDPCQGVIAALRIAIQERMPRAFIDLETADFHSYEGVFPDPYALKTTHADKFAAAVLPAIGPVPEGQPQGRVRHMANRLRELEQKYESILFVCSILDWPWIKDAYFDQIESTAEHDLVEADFHLRGGPGFVDVPFRRDAFYHRALRAGPAGTG